MQSNKSEKNKKNIVKLSVIIIVLVACYYIFLTIEDRNKTDHSPVYTKKESINNVLKPDRESDNLVETSSVKKEEVIILSKTQSLKIQELRASVKINLAAAYTGLSAFYADEKRYSSDLTILGLSPSDNPVYVKYGFSNVFIPETLVRYGKTLEDPSFNNSDVFVEKKLDGERNRYEYVEGLEGEEVSEYLRYCSDYCKVSKDQFELLGVIPYPDGLGVEAWTINNKKVLKKVYGAAP